MTTDGSVLTVEMMVEAGRARMSVRGHRRLLAKVNDESRLTLTRLLPMIVDTKPVVMMTPASRAQTLVWGHRLLVVEMNDESRLTSTRCPDVDMAKTAVTDENSCPRASDGSQPLDLAMNVSRSVVTDNEGFPGRPPVVGVAKPVVMATDG